MLTGFHPNLAENLSEVLSAPQKAATQLVTGKYQTPSEAMGIQNAAGAFLTDVVLDPLGLMGLGAGAKAAKASTKTGILSKAYLKNPIARKELRDPNKSFRVAGMDAYDDFVESGVVRSRTPMPMPGMSFAEKMKQRPTAFPSFQKGYADMHYLPEEGGVVFETSLPTFRRGDINPVTGNPVKGRHYAHRVIDTETGNVLYSVPGKDIKVYKGKPHWLMGYQEIKPPKKKQDGGAIEGTMGGLTNKGFNFNPAWGGAWRDGGKLTENNWLDKYQDGGKSNQASETEMILPEVVVSNKEKVLRHTPSASGNYQLTKTVTPFKTNRQIRKGVEAPLYPNEVNFISNYAGAIGSVGSVDSLPSAVPFEGEKHWNIDRFIMDPAFSEEYPNLRSGQSKKGLKKNVLADMYKYYMLQGQDKDDAFRSAKQFMRQEINPRLNSKYFKEASRLTGVHNQPITEFANQNPFIDLRNINEDESLRSNPFYKEYFENPITEREMKQISKSYLKNFKKMSGKESRKKVKEWIKEANAPEVRFQPSGISMGQEDYRDGGNLMPPMAGADQTVPMYAMGGSLPGSVGFMYARTAGAAPSEGPYAKKTLPSAQNGAEMSFYQQGLDWKPKNISKNGGWLDKFDDEVPQAQTGFLTQRYSTGPMMGDLATQSGVPTQGEVARQDQLRKEVEAAKQKQAAIARYKAMPKIGPAKQRNYSEQVAAEEQRRRLNQQYADQNPEVTVDDSGDIVPSGYGRFMQTYGSNLDKFARSLETPLAIEGALSLAPLVGRGAVAAGEYFTTQTPVRNAYKLNPASGKIPIVGEKPNWLRGYSKDYTDPTKIDFSGMSRFSDPISKSNINKLNQLDNEWRALSQAERDTPEIYNQYYQAKQRLLLDSRLQNTGLGKLFNVDDVMGAGSYSEFVSPLKYSPDVVLKYSTKEPFEGATRSLFEAGKSIRDPQIGLPFHLQELSANRNIVLTPRMQGNTFGLAQGSAEPISRSSAAEIALKLRQLNKQGIYPDWQGYNFLRNPETGGVSIIDLNTIPGSGAAEAFVEGSRVGQNPATIIKQNWNLQPKQRKGGVVKDDMGYWNPNNWGKVVEIDSNDITMKGVNQPLIGVSDEGDVKYMEPGKDYKFKGKKVKEYPIGAQGVSVNKADEYPLEKLDNLLNFTNYNKPKAKNGWLEKYK
jgi:hypothetical protein